MPSKRRSSAPNARTTPLWTMCSPHKRSATPPIRSRMAVLPMTVSSNRPRQRVGLGIAEALHGLEDALLVAESRVLDAPEGRDFQAIARNLPHVDASHLQLLDEA